MGDSLITIIAIFLAAILMFVVPLVFMADKTDNVNQLAVQSAVTEFVKDVSKSGKLTLEKYDKLVNELTATGNSYEINMVAQILDENPGVKTTQAASSKIGENVYYNIYTTQIEQALEKGTLTLKEGDMFSVTVKNTNKTISQIMKNFLYKVSGSNTYEIAAQDVAMVTVNGSK